MDAQTWSDAKSDVLLDHISGIDQGANGIVLDVSGYLARAGLSGVTCDVDPDDGSVSTDYDLPGNSETVLDLQNDTVLVSTSRGLYMHEMYPANKDEAPLLEVDGEYAGGDWYVESAALTADGVLAIYNDWGVCAAHWTGSDTWMDMSFDDCSPRVSMDTVTSSAWIAGRDGVWVMDEVQAVNLGPGGIAEWGAGQAWVADGTQFRGVNVDGSPIFSFDLPGEIVDVAVLDGQDAAGVLIDHESGMQFAVFGTDGRLHGWTDVRHDARDIEASYDGTTIAVNSRDQVDFFVVHCP